jgi:hypothetical protein
MEAIQIQLIAVNKMEFLYILFEQTPTNQTEYDSLVSTYDTNGNIAKQSRDLTQYVKIGEEQVNQDGTYKRDSEQRILVKDGYFYWLLPKLEKDPFLQIEQSGQLVGWSYQKMTLDEARLLLANAFLNRYAPDPEI